MVAVVRSKRDLDFLLTLIDGWIKLVWTLIDHKYVDDPNAKREP